MFRADRGGAATVETRAGARYGVAKILSEDRTNSSAKLPVSEVPHAMAFAMRIGLMLRMSVAHAEPVRVLHYTAAQAFKPHGDAFDIATLDSAGLAALEGQGGQRLFSSMVYLNAPEDGGATVFPDLERAISPVPGRLLIFANTVSGTAAPNPLSVHAGESVTAGEKWAAITWWRQGAHSASAG